MLTNITRFFLERPIMVTITVLGVFIYGGISAYNARKEGFPEISLNRVTIRTIYPGASSHDVELNITVLIEEALEKVEGIKEVTSHSEEGLSTITVEADNNATAEQFRKLYNDVEQVVTEIDDFPEDIDGRPTISEFTSGDIPVFEVAFQGEYPVLKPYLDKLEQKITRMPGIAYVDMVGLPDPEVQVLVDPKKAAGRNIGLADIARAIQARNLEGSGGTLESFTSEKKVVFVSKYENYREILDTVLRANFEGYATTLKDIATVKILPKDNKLIVRNNGRHGAVLSVKKTGSSDLVKVVDKVRETLEAEKMPEGVTYKVLLDQSHFTRNRISLLLSNAGMGFVLVCLILLAVFNFGQAFWTAFGIPFTLFALVIFMEPLGVTINLISLGGFIIIIGMLVDDAIVIAEEVASNREKGMPPAEAAVAAVRHMALPVTGAVLTTIVAFSPLFQVGGFPGKFVWAIPLIVIVGLLLSLFESFFILPAHLAHLKQNGDGERRKHFVVWLEHKYRYLLTRVLHHPLKFLGLLAVFLVLSVLALRFHLVKDPFPQEAAEGFTLKITSPPGTPVRVSEDIIREVENILAGLPEKERVGFSARVGTHSEASNMNLGTQANLARVFVYLTPYADRHRTAREIMAAVQKAGRDRLGKKYPDTELLAELSRLGPPMGKPVEIRVIQNDDTKRNLLAKDIRSYLAGLPGVSGVTDDDIRGKNELNLKMDYESLAASGLRVADVLTALRIAFDGQVVTSMTTLDGELDFRLRLNEAGRSDPGFIGHLPMTNQYGQIIRLETFTKIKEQEAPGSRFHIHGDRALTITANIDLELTNPGEVMEMVDREFGTRPEAEIEFAGQPVETNAIFADLGVSAVVALVGIFFIISMFLNSFRRTFAIVLPLPFLVIGVVFTLVTHGLPVSMLAGMALVGLMGVVVNDSIVMVHRIEEKISEKFTEGRLVQAAVERLRPVLLTTVTTVAGVLPTGYGIGGYDPFLSQMCLVTAYGLLFASCLTLFLVPVFYHLGHTRVAKLLPGSQEADNS